MRRGSRSVLALLLWGGALISSGCDSGSPQSAGTLPLTPSAGSTGGDAAARATALPSAPMPSGQYAATASAASPCPPAGGSGTTTPAVSIDAILFAVNGAYQWVRAGDSLEAEPGDVVLVKEAVICSASFSGQGGEACVDLAPLDDAGEEIVAAHIGTHLVPVTAGRVTLLWPGPAWTIGETWTGFVAALNHWLPTGAQDPAGGSRRFEVDDRLVIGFR